MEFNDFAARWQQMEEQNEVSFLSKWVRLPEGDFPFLRPDELAFLRQAGLPSEAPYFSFKEVEKAMPRVDQVYGPDDEQLWTKIGRETVAAFRMLGSNSGGDPLVLDINSHEIWQLDHEGYFAPYNLVNTSLLQFAESLFLFQQAEFQEAEVDVDELLKQLRALDPRAAQKGAFWPQYAEDLNDLR